MYNSWYFIEDVRPCDFKFHDQTDVNVNIRQVEGTPSNYNRSESSLQGIPMTFHRGRSNSSGVACDFKFQDKTDLCSCLLINVHVYTPHRGGNN